MKRFLVTALATAMIAVSLVGCGGNKGSEEGNGTKVEDTQDKYADVSPKEVVQQLVDGGYIVMPMPIDDAMATEMFHINMDDIEEYSIAKTGMSPGIGFAMVVKAKDGKVDAVKEAAEKVLADQVNNAFYPEEKEVAESAKIRVDGNIVSLMMFNPEVSADAEAAYDEALNK